jgi:hypothetical protein
MPHCPSCGAEFRAGFTECNTCHVPLVTSSGAAAKEAYDTADFEGDSLRLLSSFDNDAQAAFTRRLLDEAGVPSVIQGGHTADVKACEPYRILVDEDYFEAAQETIESFRSPSLVTGQIEGNLSRLRDELDNIAAGREDLFPKIHAVEESLERLQNDLRALNQELDESE